MTDSYDAVVIGGGPGGAVSAMTLARAGLRVCVLEKTCHPRFHIGESILPRAFPLIQELGLESALKKLPHVPKYGAEFGFGNDFETMRFEFSSGLTPGTPTFNIERSHFDQMLLDAAREAGAEVLEEAPVREIRQLSAHGAAVIAADREFTGRLLFDCSGHAAVVGRRLGTRRVFEDPHLQKVAYFQHFDHVERPPGLATGHPTILMTREGWFWIIGLSQTRTSVGFVTRPAFVKEIGVPPERLLRWAIGRCPVARHRMRHAIGPETNHVLADFSYTCRPFAGPGYFLVGDAGCFLDPIFSTGVTLAMMGGREAARLAIEILHGNARPAAAARDYCRFVEGSTGVFWRLIRNYYNHPFRELFMEGQGPLQVHRAVISTLAGQVFPKPAWSLRWRLWFFQLCVELQRFIPLCPRRPECSLLEESERPAHLEERLADTPRPGHPPRPVLRPLALRLGLEEERAGVRAISSAISPISPLAVPGHPHIPLSSLLQRMLHHAQTRPNACAFRTVADGELSYRDLAGAVASLAAVISERVTPAAPIILSCSNVLQYPIAFLSILAAGRTVFPISPDAADAELLRAAEESGAAAVIGDSRAIRLLGPTRRLAVSLDQVPRAGSDPLKQTARGALLLQSSGTTGLPKIVCRGGGSLDAAAEAMVQAIGFTAADHVLMTIPLTHSYGLEHGLLAPVWAGGCVHLRQGLALPEALDEIAAGGITILPGVPSTFEMLSRAARSGATSPLRIAYSAGAPLPSSVAEAFSAAFRVRVTQLYGASEIGSVTYDPPAADQKSTSVGFPMNGVSIRILDLDDPTACPFPAGREGQVAIRAASMFDCYLNETAGLIDGHFLTGDLGYLDAAGRLFITGRIKLVIDVGGFKVNPLEVEAVLQQHPSVAACLVVPVQQSETVIRLKALITPSQAAGAVPIEELRQLARAHLAAYKVPRLFEVRDTLPRSPTGKILRHLVETA